MSKLHSYHPSPYRVPEVGIRRNSFLIRYSTVGLILVGVGGASLMTFVASAFSVTLLKPIAILMLAIAGFGTLKILKKYSYAINHKKAILMIFILSIMPVIRIFLEVVPTLDTRNIIDGLLVIAPYYFLPFSGLSIVALLASTSITLDTVLRRSFFPLAILIALFAGAGFYTLNSARVVGVYTIYDNLLIPMSFLLFFPSNRRNLLLGALALSTVFVLSTLQASRSYLLVVLYIGVSALLLSGRRRGIRYVLALFLSIIVFQLAPLIAQLDLLRGSNATIAEKLRIDTLLPAIDSALRNSDFLALYFWEGNSRAGILLDAFADFSPWDYFWGRGVTATYDSFVVRNTIEVGYAQEVFWLGLATVIPTLFFAFVSLGGILSKRGWRMSQIGAAFIAVALTRMLDGFIYGKPSLSLYALLFWMLVMSFALKAGYRRALFESGTAMWRSR